MKKWRLTDYDPSLSQFFRWRETKSLGAALWRLSLGRFRQQPPKCQIPKRNLNFYQYLLYQKINLNKQGKKRNFGLQFKSSWLEKYIFPTQHIIFFVFLFRGPLVTSLLFNGFYFGHFVQERNLFWDWFFQKICLNLKHPWLFNHILTE